LKKCCVGEKKVENSKDFSSLFFFILLRSSHGHERKLNIAKKKEREKGREREREREIEGKCVRETTKKEVKSSSFLYREAEKKKKIEKQSRESTQ
jgi:hypothetical protein